MTDLLSSLHPLMDVLVVPGSTPPGPDNLSVAAMFELLDLIVDNPHLLASDVTLPHQRIVIPTGTDAAPETAI